MDKERTPEQALEQLRNDVKLHGWNDERKQMLEDLKMFCIQNGMVIPEDDC